MAHSTLWQPGVGELVPRPGDDLEAIDPGAIDPDAIDPDEQVTTRAVPARAKPGRSGRQTAQDWVPPALWRAAQRAKGAIGH